MRQLVAFPQLIEDLLLLHRARRALLLEPADAALNVEHIFVQLPAAAVALPALGLKRKLRPGKLFKRGALFLRLHAQRGELRFMRADLALRLLVRGSVLFDERASALLVALHLPAQALQALKRPFRRLALGGIARERALLPGDLVAETRGRAQQLALAGKALFRLCAQLARLLFLRKRERFLFLHGALRLAAAARDGLAFIVQRLEPLAQRREQQVVVVLFPLQLEHGVLRRALLTLRDLQLVSRPGKLALGVLGRLGGEIEPFGKASAPCRQLAQLARAAQDARAAGDRAARHRTAAV